MGKLLTPFGEIKILIDGDNIAYNAAEGEKFEGLCPDVLARYQIKIKFIPDGKSHTIACIFTPNCKYEAYVESGERLECQGFYNDFEFKMSIGLEGECCSKYFGGDFDYDYDIDYLTNGMSYIITPGTKTEDYIFGISWIDDANNPEINSYSNTRETQTWFGADPNLRL